MTTHGFRANAEWASGLRAGRARRRSGLAQEPTHGHERRAAGVAEHRHGHRVRQQRRRARARHVDRTPAIARCCSTSASATTSRDAGRFDLQAGYDFSQSLHDDFDAFDVRIHRGSATLSYDSGRVDIGTTLQHAYAELDGNEFLTLQQISPYVSKLVGQPAVPALRVRAIRTRTSRAIRRARPTANALSADAYVFVDGLTTYLVFGYRHDDEDAIDAQFDYARRHAPRAALEAAHGRRARAHVADVRCASRDRDYDSPTPSIGAPRRDDRAQLELSLEFRWASA